MVAVLLVIIIYHLHVHIGVFSKVKCFHRLTAPLQIFFQICNRECNTEDYTELVDVDNRPIHVYPRPKLKPTYSVVEITDVRDQTQSPQQESNAQHIKVEQEIPINLPVQSNLVQQDKSAQTTCMQSGVSSGAEYQTADEMQSEVDN